MTAVFFDVWMREEKNFPPERGFISFLFLLYVPSPFLSRGKRKIMPFFQATKYSVEQVSKLKAVR